MGHARRWTMKGPWKHPNGVCYYRGEVPKDIWDGRERLAALGVRLGSGKEIRRSLATRDKKAAEAGHAVVVSDLNAQWAAYRHALIVGPIALSERNVVAIAGERSKRFLREHQDNPSIGAVPPSRPAPVLPESVSSALSRLSADEEAKLRDALVKILEKDGGLSNAELALKLDQWDHDPVLSLISRAIIEPVASALSAEHLKPLRDLLGEQRLVVDGESTASLLVAAARFQAKARNSLKTMAEHDDYREPEWVRGVPAYSSTPSARTFDTVIDDEAKRRALGKDARPLPAKTVVSFKAVCAKFAKYRGRAGKNAATVTAAELDGWKTEMMTSGEVSNRTVANRIGTIKTIIRWARGLYRGEFSRMVGDLEEVALPDFTPKPSDLSAIHPDEALVILRAARKETDPRLRWLSWLCAYSGLRIAEACQLQTTDFFESEGHWFFDVSTSGKRSLKTISSRRTIPIHRALIMEGFLGFIKELAAGPVFAAGASAAVTRWFHTLENMHEGVSPNHGWRHLFKDLCRRYELSDDARHYLTGHSTGGADQGYGHTRAMLPGLWRQMERIEPFAV